MISLNFFYFRTIHDLKEISHHSGKTVFKKQDIIQTNQ